MTPRAPKLAKYYWDQVNKGCSASALCLVDGYNRTGNRRTGANILLHHKLAAGSGNRY